MVSKTAMLSPWIPLTWLDIPIETAGGITRQRAVAAPGRRTRSSASI
jgi:hypothetical protein